VFQSQQADERPVAFSFSTEKIEQPQIDCYIGYTTSELHESIRKNLHESPLYSGQIKGVGPRYCPSIEDKVVKFADKDRHQLFLEPEGHDTNEVYLNGFSTSLPAGLQQELVRMIPGLESASIIRPGYAIEYDYVDPRELGPDLQVRRIAGLFHAGQINGTTGYEEAACQGLLAGINAALLSQGRPPFGLRREESYVGVLVDDLITQGVDEPYRIFTSRAEYRLAFRHDNADQRLSSYGREIGLVGDSEWERFNQRRDRIAKIKKALQMTRIRKSDPAYIALSEKTPLKDLESITLEDLAKRSGMTSVIISQLLPAVSGAAASLEELEFALADNLYSGYIKSQENTIQRLHAHDTLAIPSGLNFRAVSGLSHEMAERLERAQPVTFGAARRIPGITPAALATLLVNVSVGA
jgi:tRNA uridine 5-carboxymethylaminomethyl modification enzyme